MASAQAGKFLRIDLSRLRSEAMDTVEYAARFLGGRGVASAIYFDEVPPEAGFDHPDNRLIVAVGPLAGMPGGLGGSRWGIYGKSPFPRAEHGGRDHYCYGNLGGSFGAELRFSGWDGLVVHGQADAPVVVIIEDERVEFLPADELWGLSTVETRRRLDDGLVPRRKVLAIGPAGENLVPLATVFADGDASCSGGMGAVMGAKRCKAIAVRGSARRVEVADRPAWDAIARQIRGYHRGNVKVWGMDFMAHGPETKKAPCHGCMAHCLRVKYTAADGTRGKYMCQSRFFYLDHALGFCGVENDVPFFANRLCDEYGIDTWEVQALIDWLLACRAEGLIAEREGDLDLSRVGSLEFIRDLVRMTSLRQGLGELLSLGARAAARSRGGQAEALCVRSDPYDPRYCPVNTLLFPFETREPIQQLHEAGLVLSQWSSWAKGVSEAHITSEVLRGIASRFWGGEAAADMTSLVGKAEAARRIQDRQFAKECLGVCDWMFPLIDVPRAADPVGDPGFESRILSAALGVETSESDLGRYGARAFHVQRAILLREGHRARVDDLLPAEWLDQPIETHVADPDLLAPDGAGRVVSQIGRRIRWSSFLALRDEYYGLRAWDVPSGLPTRAGLGALGLDDLAADLAGRGLLRERARGVSIWRRLGYGRRRWTERIGALFSGQGSAGPAEGPSLAVEELERILGGEQQKFNLPAIGANFVGWNKSMVYVFPDLDARYLIRFVDGQAQKPERLAGPPGPVEIEYEMKSWVLAALADGRLSGKKAYFKRLLRIKASFGDMMKLQALNKV